MEIHDDFQTIGLCPRNSFCEVRKLPLNVRFPPRHVKGPVSDRQPYMVEPIEHIISSNTPVTHDMVIASTHPAAAIAAKSDSVIQVFQWFWRTLNAVALLWNCPNVYSSTIWGFPVLSKMEGVIQGWNTRHKGGELPYVARKLTSSTSQPPRFTPRTFSEP